MATVYSGAQYIGGSAYRRYRAVLTYSTSTSNTAVTISWSATVQMADAAQYGVAITCEGVTGTGYISSSSSSYKDVKTISGTTTVNRGTSASTRTITAQAYGTTVSGYGSAGGSTSVSASISIPALASYTVSYNANGGSGAPSSQTKYYGKDLTLSTTVPTKTGYNFLGWSTSSTATSASYSAGGKYTSNASATLYAVWQLKTYTVSYDANNGTGAPSNQTKSHGIDLTLSATTPTRNGYDFLGWATSASGSVAYQPSAIYTSNAALKLYAVWKAHTYTVTYDANGGTDAPAAQIKTHDISLTLSSELPVREGYEFLGWGTSAQATAASYSPGGIYTTESNITLYAIWSLIPMLSISYDSDGGDYTPNSQSHLLNKTTYFSGAKPKKDGYSFSGWALTKGATQALFLPGHKYVNNNFQSGDILTLYAVWTRTYDIKIKVPDYKTIRSIRVKLPYDLPDLNAINAQVLYDSTGAELLDSNGNSLQVREG